MTVRGYDVSEVWSLTLSTDVIALFVARIALLERPSEVMMCPLTLYIQTQQSHNYRQSYGCLLNFMTS